MKKELSMEARLLIAFVLMGLVLFLTPYIYKPATAPAPGANQPATSKTTDVKEAATPPPVVPPTVHPLAPLERTAVGAIAPAPAPHKIRPRVERRPVRPSEPPANPETSETVKRGVLPAGSREAYPQK